MPTKRVALALEFLANFAKIVNLAVVDNPVSSLRILHRLMTKGRGVENRETLMAESDFYSLRDGVADDDGAGVIGTAMGKRLGSAIQKVWIHTRVLCEDTDNTAHRMCAPAYMRSTVDISIECIKSQIDVYELMSL